MNSPRVKQKDRIGRTYWTIILVAAAVAIPGLTGIAWLCIPSKGVTLQVIDLASRFPASRLDFRKLNVGEISSHPARIANVQIVDFDQDSRMDILVCDCVRNTVLWYRQTSDQQWDERPLASDNAFAAPAHATIADVDSDGDRDVLVAVLGSVWPTDDRVGRLVLLENTGQFRFQPRVLLEDLRRVADVQAGDLDGDGDQDLVVAEFGFERGRVFWMENRGGGRYRDIELLNAPGAVHVPIGDYDLDGDLDVATVITQEEEEVWIFENPGQGKFIPRRHRVHFTTNFDLGGAGLVTTDLDQDGDLDFLLSAGDNLDLFHYPQPYHGCFWLDNQTGLKFEAKRIAKFGGTYAAHASDFDDDGDLDVVLASMFNDWRRPGTASLAWFENDGKQNFTPWQIDSSPSHLCTVSSGDLNGDGRPDIVAGSLHIVEPYERLGRVTAWIQNKESR